MRWNLGFHETGQRTRRQQVHRHSEEGFNSQSQVSVGEQSARSGASGHVQETAAHTWNFNAFRKLPNCKKLE